MIHKPIDALNEQDILDLVDNEMSEGKTLDYKRDLPADNNDGKAEFLADVVSFANTAGGYMLFGVDEDKGVAIAVPGIELKDTMNMACASRTCAVTILSRECHRCRYAGLTFHQAAAC